MSWYGTYGTGQFQRSIYTRSSRIYRKNWKIREDSETAYRMFAIKY